MKHILCFGDSNTWGYIPGSGGQRYDLDQRWTGILQQELGVGTRVIEEGLNGRTTLWEDPTVPLRRSGLAWLPACLDSHRPLDLVVLMLGTNDLKVQFALTPEEIAFGAARLVREVLAHPEWGLTASIRPRCCWYPPSMSTGRCHLPSGRPLGASPATSGACCWPRRIRSRPNCWAAAFSMPPPRQSPPPWMASTWMPGATEAWPWSWLGRSGPFWPRGLLPRLSKRKQQGLPTGGPAVFLSEKRKKLRHWRWRFPGR